MPTDNSRVCSLHFRESDYRVLTTDTNVTRKNKDWKEKNDELQKKVLRDDAIPNVFQDLPQYYTKQETERRSETNSVSSRFKREYDAVELQVEEFQAKDCITSLEQVVEMLNNESNLSKDILKVNTGKTLTIFSLQENEDGRPLVKYSLIISDNLQLSMWCNEVKVPFSKVSDLCSNKKIVLFSGVLNILTRLKNMSEGSEKIICTKDTVQFCCELLTEVLPELDEEMVKKISFVKEQLKLSITPKMGRRYSGELLATCVLWDCTSPALFKQIHFEGALTTPTPKHIQRLKVPFNAESGLTESGKRYLKTRFSGLSDREKVVNLILDEVYSAKRVEYSNGTFYGYENQTVTKTLLGFMIKSVGGKFMDMVCLFPVDQLDSEILHSMWKNVLKEVTEIGFDVVSNTLDGHSINQKFYTKFLGEGELQLSIPHPYKNDGSRIFLLYDYVHIFKCIYNNFVNKRRLLCPKYDGLIVAPDMNHIESLRKIELGRPLKYAHKLTDKVLHPMPIQKTNVQLADSLFHESTIEGLVYYSKHGHPEFMNTANFLRIIRTWWNVCNVKNRYAGQRTRDLVRTSISNDENVGDMGGVQLLTKFAGWIKLWENTCIEKKDFKHGLSRETFKTSQHTSRGLAAVAIYLIDEKGFSYVLLAFLSGDPIERRFGWYRQLSGANYFLSVRQFLEAEKKIRLQTLIKFGKLSFKEASVILQGGQRWEDTEKEARELLTLIGFDFKIDFDVKDEQAILFYIAGFLSFGELRKISCESCISLFAKDTAAPKIKFDDAADFSQYRAEFLEQINRGGLCTPSDAMYICALYARQLFLKTFDNGDIQKHFFTLKCQRNVFTACLEIKMQFDTNSAAILAQTCQNEEPHKFSERIRSIGDRVFNTFSKNFITERNDEINEAKKRKGKGNDKESQAARKIAKLTNTSNK